MYHLSPRASPLVQVVIPRKEIKVNPLFTLLSAVATASTSASVQTKLNELGLTAEKAKEMLANGTVTGSYVTPDKGIRATLVKAADAMFGPQVADTVEDWLSTSETERTADFRRDQYSVFVAGHADGTSAEAELYGKRITPDADVVGNAFNYSQRGMEFVHAETAFNVILHQFCRGNLGNLALLADFVHLAATAQGLQQIRAFADRLDKKQKYGYGATLARSLYQAPALAEDVKQSYNGAGGLK